MFFLQSNCVDSSVSHVLKFFWVRSSRTSLTVRILRYEVGKGTVSGLGQISNLGKGATWVGDGGDILGCGC